MLVVLVGFGFFFFAFLVLMAVIPALTKKGGVRVRRMKTEKKSLRVFVGLIRE